MSQVEDSSISGLDECMQLYINLFPVTMLEQPNAAGGPDSLGLMSEDSDSMWIGCIVYDSQLKMTWGFHCDEHHCNGR